MRGLCCASPIPICCSTDSIRSPFSSLSAIQSPSAFLLPPHPKTLARARIQFHRSSSSRFRSNSGSNGSPSSSSEDRDNRTVLNAFFLGKAFAEALNERVESTVGEILSVVGQWQAEQQKEVLDFQEEVLERAKRAQEKAALEAMGTQALTYRPSPSSPMDTAIPPTATPVGGDPLQDLLKD